MTRKLYKVTCRGMQSSIGSCIVHGIAFVVATNPDQAYRKLLKYLEKEDLGYDRDRELETIELIAEDDDYPDCQTRLFQ